MIRRLFRKFHASYVLVGWSVFVIIAMVLASVFGGVHDERAIRMIGQDVVLSGVVVEDAENDGSVLSLRLGNIELQGQSVAGMAYVKVSTSEKIERSDRVTLSGRVSEGFGVFAVTMWRPYLKKLEKPNPPDIALNIREWFSGRVRQFIESPQADLALGYLLGQKRALPEGFSELLNEVGLTHIVVASGYNLSILVGSMRKIFKRVSRFTVLMFGLILVVCFMAIVGLSASMVRAGIVTLFGIFAWYVGRKFHPIKLLLLIAAITLLMNPIYIMDLGWMLSFASFAGVMIVGPVIVAYFYEDEKPNFLAAVLIETISAQLCCLPIILYYSGSFSLVSVIANVLILPTIPVTMALTFATGTLAFLPAVANICGMVASWILSYHIGVVEFFGGMKWAIFGVEPGNAMIFVGYGIIIVSVYYMKRRAKFKFIDNNVLEL